MKQNLPTATTLAPRQSVQKTVFSILFTISFAHLLNDMMQSVIPAVYPLIKEKSNLYFNYVPFSR